MENNPCPKACKCRKSKKAIAEYVIKKPFGLNGTQKPWDTYDGICGRC